MCLVLVQVIGRLNPFPVWTHRRGASASLGLFPWYICVGNSLPLMPPLRDDQYISLSPTDSPGDDTETDLGATALGQASHGGRHVGKGLTRMPADTPRTPGPRNVDFQQFCDRLRMDLPGDSHGRGSFDTSARFVAGDPGAKFGATAPLEYEVTGEIGHPHWELIFEYVLRQCGYLVEFHTVYVMVDNRDLGNHKRQDPSLPHWPAAARWWHSRLKLIGPHKEKTELLLFPISATTGLHHVHPTWAGTFVLAALVAMFPGLNFVLLDSDCLPVTLFEVEDLWTEAFLARFPAHSDGGIPQAHPLPAFTRFRTDPQVVYTQHRVCSTRMGQGALVVTEPHSELNAGLIVISRSSHPPLFDWNAWSLRFRSSPGSVTDEELKEEASRLAVTFWGRIGEFLMRSRTGSELSPEEKALWIQSGLAVSPLMGTCLLAWALIGEWTSRVLFPVPKGPWPRHGHAGALLQNYQCRTPRLVAWARAAFEQGALPSLLMMPGLAPVFSLPGDRMFQATGVTNGYQRPAIMHAYGGAKTGMERSLASIAPEGWLPMAAAMLGTVDKPPMWASVGLRPVVGTTIDFKVLPPILFEREKLLMLSCWQQWDPTSVPGSALSQWLVGIEVEHGPDGLDSPTYLKQNFNVQEAADLYQAVHLGTLEDLFATFLRRMALTLKSSANLRSGSLPMSTPWVPSLQFIFSLSQGICRTSSPLTSGLRQ